MKDGLGAVTLCQHCLASGKSFGVGCAGSARLCRKPKGNTELLLVFGICRTFKTYESRSGSVLTTALKLSDGSFVKPDVRGKKSRVT